MKSDLLGILTPKACVKRSATSSRALGRMASCVRSRSANRWLPRTSGHPTLLSFLMLAMTQTDLNVWDFPSGHMASILPTTVTQQNTHQKNDLKMSHSTQDTLDDPLLESSYNTPFKKSGGCETIISNNIRWFCCTWRPWGTAARPLWRRIATSMGPNLGIIAWILVKNGHDSNGSNNKTSTRSSCTEILLWRHFDFHSFGCRIVDSEMFKITKLSETSLANTE